MRRSARAPRAGTGQRCGNRGIALFLFVRGRDRLAIGDALVARKPRAARLVPRARGLRVVARPIAVAGAMRMQSTGHGAMHSSQPEHNDGRIACMRLAAPMIASTGHASMHSVHPMQADSSMTATSSGPGVPHAGSTGLGAQSSRAASDTTTASPPGGQRSMSASPRATAAAYGAQPS